MTKFSCLLVLSVLVNFITASNLRDEDCDEERRLNKSKRVKREANTNTSYDFGINTVTSLLRTTGLDTQIIPALDIFNMTDREIESVIDEAFFELKFDEIKFLYNRGLLDEKVTNDHMSLLCRNRSSEAFEIIKYLLENKVESAISVCREYLTRYLPISMNVNFEIFKILWDNFGSQSLDKKSEAIILSVAASNYNNEAYEFILSRQGNNSDSFHELMTISLSLCTSIVSDQNALKFFMKKRINFKDFSSIDTRIKILMNAARTCEPEFTEYILNDEDMRGPLIQSQKAP